MHPAKQKAQLRKVFETHRVVTTVSLERRGLLQAAEWLDYPRLDLDVRPQAHQASSLTTMTFVARDEEWLRQAPRDVLHHAFLAEGAFRLAKHMEATQMRFEYLDLKGRSGVWPDAQLVSPRGREHDASVEVDTGYPPKRCDAKLIAAAEGGFGTIVWLTSVHGRVKKIDARIKQLQAAGELGRVKQASVAYVDVHRTRPYAPRRRLHKVSSLNVVFGQS